MATYSPSLFSVMRDWPGKSWKLSKVKMSCEHKCICTEIFVCNEGLLIIHIQFLLKKIAISVPIVLASIETHWYHIIKLWVGVHGSNRSSSQGVSLEAKFDGNTVKLETMFPFIVLCNIRTWEDLAFGPFFVATGRLNLALNCNLIETHCSHIALQVYSS